MTIQERVQPGDIWQLGPHRLLCGDATDPADVSRLMAGRRASIAVTSPPYNLGHSAAIGYMTRYGRRQTSTSKYALRRDHLPEADYVNLLVKATRNALAHADTVALVLQQVAGNKVAMVEYLYELRCHLVDTAIWDKGSASPALARRVMNSRFEFLFFFSPSHRPKRSITTASFHGTVDNVYHGSIQRHNSYFGLHAATFPIHLPRWLIQTFDTTGGIVLDPFLGTGTTLIAAHELGRICYGIEIEPSYCDIVLDRLEKATGLTPSRLCNPHRSRQV
jgi:DNA modification methylase